MTIDFGDSGLNWTEIAAVAQIAATFVALLASGIAIWITLMQRRWQIRDQQLEHATAGMAVCVAAREILASIDTVSRELDACMATGAPMSRGWGTHLKAEAKAADEAMQRIRRVDPAVAAAVAYAVAQGKAVSKLFRSGLIEAAIATSLDGTTDRRAEVDERLRTYLLEFMEAKPMFHFPEDH